MTSKHYDSKYLEETGRVLNNLKTYSYQPFIAINSGLIVDLGCGIGQDVTNMAGLVNNNVKIIGIDHDADMIGKAKDRQQNFSNIDFIQSEANHIPFDDESISGIRSERLIQHLINPEKVFSEIHRTLKSNHPVLIVETDWQSLFFYNEFVSIGEKINKYLTKEKINNGMAARKLICYMENAGFKEISINLFPFIIKTYQEANDYFFIDRVLQEVVEKTYISEQEFNLFKKALKISDEKKYFACSINIVVATARK